jgi:hypothetical protein
MKNITLFIFTILFAMLSCSKDHVHASDHETITVFKYILTAPDGSQSSFTYEDYDGEGGNAGRKTVSILKANTNYTGRIEVYTGDSGKLTQITDEIKSEGVDHEFFYQFNTTGAPTVLKTDVDVNNNPLGINTTFKTANTGVFPLTIILRHKPKKPNTSLQTAGGDTDVEVVFEMNVM